MEDNAKKLNALLCDEGRKLVNLKFFLGSKAKSADDLFVGAYEMVSRALNGEGKGLILGTESPPVHFSTLSTMKQSKAPP